MALAAYAAGTLEVARNLEEAHRLGVSPGPCREPWGIDYQRRAVPIYLETVPEPHVRRFGENAAICARLMRSRQVADEPAEWWALLTEQYESVALAVAEHLDVVLDPGRGPTLPCIGPVPGILRYEKLARFAHPDGVERLGAAALGVEAYCRRAAHSQVSNVEIEWLRAFARGARTAELAAAEGRSEREFYRILRRLWERLGVDSRTEAVALAARMGWLDETGR